MIRPEQVFLAVEPLDMRWGAERLSCHVQQLVGRSPCDGTAYAFSNRDRTRLKLLVWDGTGVWLCQRRLHSGRFRWPVLGDTVYQLNLEEWQWLVTGVDWQRLTAKPPAHWSHSQQHPRCACRARGASNEPCRCGRKRRPKSVTG